jgi:hypothetical protein
MGWKLGFGCVLRLSQQLEQGILLILLSGMRLSPLSTVDATVLMYQPHMIDDGDCGAVGRIKIGRGNRSTRRKPAPLPRCPPQIRLWTALLLLFCQTSIAFSFPVICMM